MQRGDNKLEKSKRKMEEIDDRLREAGLYDGSYSQETKAKLLELVEESLESARQKEEERQNLRRMEERIMAESLNKSSSHKENSDRSISNNNRCREEKANLESTSPAQHTQQECEPEPSASFKPDVKCVSTPHPGSKSRGHVTKLHTQDKEEDDDLIVLTQDQVVDSEHQSTKTKIEYSSSTTKKTYQSVRQECHEHVKNVRTSTPSHTEASSSSSLMGISPAVNKSKVISANTATATTTTTTTTTTVMTNENSEPKLARVSPSQKSPKLHQTIQNLDDFVPLTQGSSLVEKVSPVCRKDRISTKKNSVSPRENASQNSTLMENSPYFQKDFSISPRISLSTSEGSSKSTASEAAITPTSSKESRMSNLPKNSATPSIRKNLSTSPVKDSSPSWKCMSTSSTSSEVIPITTISSTTTTTTTTTTSATTNPVHALVTPTTAVIMPSDKEVRESVNNPEDSSSGSDFEVKIHPFVSIDVFSCTSVHEAPLRRKKPLCSEATNKAFHRAQNESIEQCRSRILTLMHNMALCLQQCQSHLPSLRWSPPLVIDRRLCNSLERPKPVSRQKRKLWQPEEMERKQPAQRFTRQARKYSEEASDPVADSSRTERTTKVQRLARGRTLGPRRGRKANISPLPEITNDSDSDLEITLPNLRFQLQSQSNIAEAEDTILDTKNKLKTQSQQRRKTFMMDLSSEGSDNECHVEDDVRKMDHHTGSTGFSRQRNSASASPSNSSELSIIDTELPHSKVTRPTISRLSRQGIRRPPPEVLDSTPNKLRKTHTLSQESSTMSSIPEETNDLPLASSDCTPSFEDPNEWKTNTRPNQEEEEEEKEKEEKIPCPLCQRLYSLQEIEEHASDCTGEEDSPQQHQQQTFTSGSRRLRRINNETAVAIISSSEAK